MSSDCRSFGEGQVKATNRTRELLVSFARRQTPAHWRTYPCPSDLAQSLGAWVTDLAARVRGLDRYRALLRQHQSGGANPTCQYWLGGMFSPEAFVTATRQHAAQVTTDPSMLRPLSLSFFYTSFLLLLFPFQWGDMVV